MCGRYSIDLEPGDIKKYFKVDMTLDFKPRYNVAPSQLSPVILNTDPDIVQMVRWGLKPIWFNPKRKDGLINVRAETLREKRTFKADLEKRRCLVLATGFYEWQKTEDGKQPYHIALKADAPFAFAGIWEENVIDGEKMKTYAIITTAPNVLMKPIHTRMPVLLAPGEEQRWLEEPNLDLLDPFPPELMTAYKVSTKVNNARFDRATLLEPMQQLSSM